MNTFGRIFKISLFGESHGKQVGIVIDGCPAGIPLTEADLEPDLALRRSGAKGTTPRREPDKPLIVSGTFQNFTTGAPIAILFENTNTRSRDYSELKYIPRPGHADFTGFKKFGGYNDYTGGGHFSGRITLGIVAAGAIAKKIISPVSVKASLIELFGDTDFDKVLDQAINEHDSIGGIVECISTNMPTGLGDPFFNSMESLISHAIFSIPATKGIEFGAGFKAAKMKGSQHNDKFIDINGKTSTNNSGGINGGITNGNDLVFRVAVKPTSSIGIPQKTISLKTGELTDLLIEGRHDSCIAIRIVPVIEAATAIVLADCVLVEQQRPRVFNPRLKPL